VAERVVQLLEVVDVRHNQAERDPLGPSLANGLDEREVEGAPVQERGEGVGNSFPAKAHQFALKRLHLADHVGQTCLQAPGGLAQAERGVDDGGENARDLRAVDGPREGLRVGLQCLP